MKIYPCTRESENGATMCDRPLDLQRLVLLGISLTFLTACGTRKVVPSTTTVVDGAGVHFVESPSIIADRRAVHDGSADYALQYGACFGECGDLTGDGHPEVAVIYCLGSRGTACKVDIVDFANKRALRSFEIDHCYFLHDGARIMDIDGDGKCELLIVTPDVYAAMGRWFATDQELQAYSLETGERMMRRTLDGVDPLKSPTRIIGVVDDLDHDGIRECVLCHDNGWIIAVSLRTRRIFYEIAPTIVHEPVEMRYDGKEALGITCGDLDSDHITDFVICNPDSGTCDVYSGADGRQIRTFIVGAPNSPSPSLHFSKDLLGKEHPGLLVGTPYQGGNFKDSGVVSMFDLQSGRKAREWSYPAACISLGLSVSAIEDLDGDGVQEVLAGGRQIRGSGGATVEQVVFLLPSRSLDAPIVLSTGNPDSLFGSALSPTAATSRKRVVSVMVGAPGLPLREWTEGSIWLLECGRVIRQEK